MAKFCEQCGAALGATDRFCMVCGHSVEGVAHPAEPVPPTSSPGAVPAPAPNPQAWAATPVPPSYAPPSDPAPPSPKGAPILIGILSVIVVAICAGAWWYLKGITSHPPVVDQSATNSTTPSSKTTTVPVGGATTQAAQPGDEFIGRWYPESADGEPAGDLLTFKRVNSLLVGVGKDPSNGQVEFPAGKGPKLTGVYKQGGKTMPATVEMLSDKNKLVLTLAPPQSEYETVIFFRDMGPPPDENVPGIEKITSYTEEQARELVAMKPEVAKYIRQLASKKKKVHIDVSPEDDQSYSVHVYEIVDDGDGMSHTATFNWYKVDRSTGKVSPGM